MEFWNNFQQCFNLNSVSPSSIFHGLLMNCCVFHCTECFSVTILCTYPFNVSILIFFLADNNSLCFSLRCDSIPVKCHIMWLFSSNGFVYLLCSFLNVPFQGLCWSIFQSYRYGINFWIDAPDLTIKMNVHSVDFHIVFLRVVNCFWRFSFVSLCVWNIGYSHDLSLILHSFTILTSLCLAGWWRTSN